MIGGGLCLLVGLALLGLRALSTPPHIGPAALPALQAALSSVPPGDVAGAELAGVPRPEGSTRSYYLHAGSVTTAVYVLHGALADVRTRLQAGLGGAGWGTVAGPGTPAPEAPGAHAWREVYSDGRRVLQVSMLDHDGVTSTTFILQDAPA